MEHHSTQQSMRQALILCLSIIMIMSTIPIIQGEDEANEYTTIVLTENKEFKVGDTVTLEIRFYQKDALVDPDDINVTLGDPEGGSGRYIEVNEGDSRVEKGIYRVTFKVEEGDDPWDMGAIYGSVRCTISTGRGEMSDTGSFMTTLKQEEDVMLVVRVAADKPMFSEGDTVRFYVRYTYEGSYVDPDDPGANFQVNREYQNILLTRESEGVYYYDYVSPEDGDSKNLLMEASGRYNESIGRGNGEANSDHFQIWLNPENFTAKRMEGQVGVCNFEGTSMELDVTLIYRYMNETWDEIVKRIVGTTNESGLLAVTLEYDDMQENEFLDIKIWANESSRGDRNQFAQKDLWPPIVRTPGYGFDIISEKEMMFLSKNKTYTFNYTAYENGTELANKEIFFFYYTSIWFASMEFGHDGEIGEVFHQGSTTTDENGRFLVNLTSPNKSTVIMDHFKADFGETRGHGQWKQVMVNTHFVELNMNDVNELGLDWEDFGPGGRASVDVFREWQDGGRGGVHLHTFDPEALGFDSPELGPMQVEETFNNPSAWEEINRWLALNQYEFKSQSPFTGEEFTRDLAIPDFFPEDNFYILFAGIFEDDGTQDGQTFVDYRVLDRDGVEINTLQVEFIGSATLSSEQSIVAVANVFVNPPVELADVWFEVTGAGDTNISHAVTDSDGNVSFTLTADNVTNEDQELTLYINASKDGYHNGSYNKTITILAYIPPKYLEVETNAPDTLGSEEIVEITATITHNPPVSGATMTIEIFGPATLNTSEEISDSNGLIMFTLTADNVTGENDHIFIWINATKDGYEDGMYDRVVTVNAYIAQKDMVIASSLPDNMKSEQVIPMAITATDGERIEGVYITIRAIGPAQTCKTSGTTDENGQVNCILTIHNVTGEDTTVTVFFNGTKDGYNKEYYTKVITIEAWKDPGPDNTMNITTNLPDTMESEQLLLLYVTVTDGSALSGVDITLQTTGPGNTCKSHDVTDGAGMVACSMTIHTVTGEDSVVFLYINGTKDGYQDAFYVKEITVLAYVPPDPEVVLDPVNVNLHNGASAIVQAGVQGNVTIEVKETVNPDAQDPDALDSLGIFLEITQQGDGTLNWVYIKINYDLVPAGVDPALLKLYYWGETGQEWVRIANSGVNTNGKYVWANITHLTVFTAREDAGDVTSPKITHTPVDEGDEGEEILVKVAVTDVGDGVQQVTLYYREVGADTYITVTMTEVGVSFEGLIARSDVSGKDIEYYIEATDGTNTATHPGDKGTPHTIHVKADGGDDSPGFGFLLVLGAVCLAGVIIWRRRS